MNWFDIVVGLFMVLFLVAGIRRGFIREVTGLVGLVLAFILGIIGTPIWADLIVEELHFPRSVAIVISFILIFVLVFLLFRAGGGLLFKVVHLTPLGWVDRVAGGGIGLLKGGLIASLILLLLGIFPLPQVLSNSLDSSASASPLRSLAPAVYNLLQVVFPQMKSLGEVVGQSVEGSFARGKEQVLKKSSQVVDMLQKAKASQKDEADSQAPSEKDESSVK
jgi:membrane protein required for colicin V production